MPTELPKINVLVVDDSAFMRKAITMMLESDPAIKVIGTARDGEEGIEKVRLLKPDLVTMDLEMPRMDGLSALREIMARNPTPVMMISSLTTDGAQATLDALELGAVDFIPKQMSYISLDIEKIKVELLGKIKDIACRKSILMARHRSRQLLDSVSASSRKVRPGLSAPGTLTAQVAKITKKRLHPISIVAIGSSTGGPPALQNVIPKLPDNLPVAVLIAQHMPPMFTRSLAERLTGMSRVPVREAQDGEPMAVGCVLIAPGGRQTTLVKRGAQVYVKVTDEPSNTLYKPCIDVTFSSVAEIYGGKSLGVILTGMGNNGLKGVQTIKSRGGIVIAQDEESCVVYGMPRAVINAGAADHVSPIDDIASEIISYF